MHIGFLLLAAGASSRFGGCKQLARFNGRSLVRHTLENLSKVCCDRPHIVLGAYGDDIRPEVEDLASVVSNPKWQNGLASSIAIGVRGIASQGSDGVLIALADQPLVDVADFCRMIEAFDGSKAVAAYYDHQIGVPAIFPKSMFQELMSLAGDRGAKSVLGKYHENVDLVPMPNAAKDIDTESDLLRIRTAFIDS